MRNFFKRVPFILLFLFLFVFPFLKLNAQESTKFAISFTGIGCPHCANVAPKLHEKVQEGSLILIEYEIYRNLANSQALNEYSQEYNLSLGIPQIMFNRELNQAGDTPILSNLDQMIADSVSNEIYLSNGTSVTFQDLQLNDLKRYPIIYSKDRVVIRKNLTKLTEKQNQQIKDFIYKENIVEAVENIEGSEVAPTRVQNPGGTYTFENAININGWILQWNGSDINTNINGEKEQEIVEDSSGVSIGRIITLGLADSVNPCALTILALVLISIVTYNPGSRKQILFAGLSFILAVLIMYMFYGYLIVKAFEMVQSITTIREFLYGKLGLNLILGVFAILLGILGLKDYFSYKPGSIGTEMPLFLRPKMTKLVSKATSPYAAFGVGIFVTLFLLPCTIGPYIILGGLIAGDGFINAFPPLFFYNLIFILPMLAVTILVYIGSKKAEDVKDWKDKNVRYMHLAAGILLLVIGTLIMLGKF